MIPQHIKDRVQEEAKRKSKMFADYADSIIFQMGAEFLYSLLNENKKSNDEEPKFHAVEYSGFWNIQTGEYYGDENILDAEVVGEEKAKEYANLIAKLLNQHYGNS